MKNDNVFAMFTLCPKRVNQTSNFEYESRQTKSANNEYFISRFAITIQTLLLMLGLGFFVQVHAAELIQSDVNPAKCFHKRDRGWANGNPIHVWDCGVGGDENKAWNFDAATRYIRSATNTDKCLHKREGGWANGNPIHVWDCDAGTDEMKTWDLAPYVYITPDCAQVNRLGPTFAPQVQERLNAELSGSDFGISRRKTLRINSVPSVRVGNCRIIMNLGVTLLRKFRRDANGTVRLSSTVRSISETSACLSQITVDDVNVSNTLKIGEKVYRLVANRVIPNNRCFAIDITM